MKGVSFLENELVLVVSPDHPLASRRDLTFADLEAVKWLLREVGSGTRIFTQKLLQEKGIRPQTMTIGSNGAIKQSVRAGIGVGLLPRQAVVLELAMNLVSELDLWEALPVRHWYALYPNDSPGRPVVEAFHRFLTEPVARQAIADSLIVPSLIGQCSPGNKL